MIYIETQHFSLNRILLLAIGLWPYQQSRLVRVQMILLWSILTSVIIFQFTSFVTAECTADLVIKVFSSTLFFALYVLKYNSFCINMSNLRFLLDQLQQIYNELKDENEIAIIEHCGSNGKRYTSVLILLAIPSLFITLIQPILPRIFGILVLNESQSYPVMQTMTEYFVDQEKYFGLIILHTYAVFCIGSLVLIATGSMLIQYSKHACGMFRIASYRLEHAMRNNIRHDISPENEIMINKEIIYAVDIHRKAMKFSEFLISTFEGSFFFVIALVVICLSLNLFRIVSFGGGIEEILLHSVYIFCIILYMFLANYFGQEIIDHNNHIYYTAYNVRWYVTSLHTQRLILFLLQRGNKPFHLSIGGLFVPSLESFATLISASISYFTVMYST